MHVKTECFAITERKCSLGFLTSVGYNYDEFSTPSEVSLARKQVSSLGIDGFSKTGTPIVRTL